MPLAVDIGDVAYGVGLWAILVVVPGAVTWLKGQHALFGAGLMVLGLVWMIAALRLARPESLWARKLYDEEKLARARRRYGSG